MWTLDDDSSPTIFIQEGQFKKNQLHGFGRWLTISSATDYAHYIGNWDDGELQGWGKIDRCTGAIEEGLYQNNRFTPDKSEITLFNPNVHLIARKIDF